MSPGSTARATLGGGCFWCLDAVFKALEGVTNVVSGYAGGTVKDPSYEAVCSGRTGHAEVVQVTFDPRVITFTDLLDVFFTIHDPTTKDRQGGDVGTQYRSIILYEDPEQKRVAEESIAAVTKEGVWDAPLVTEIAPLGDFYSAESYHQDYYAGNPDQPYCAAVIRPKVAKFRKRWAHRLKPEA